MQVLRETDNNMIIIIVYPRFLRSSYPSVKTMTGFIDRSSFPSNIQVFPHAFGNVHTMLNT